MKHREWKNEIRAGISFLPNYSTTLFGSQTSATTLRLSGSLKRAWPLAAEVASRPRGVPRPILRDVDTKRPSGYFLAVHLLDGFCSLLFRRKTDKGEAAGASGDTIGWQMNVDDFADFGEELAKLLIGRAEVEVAYEYLV